MLVRGQYQGEPDVAFKSLVQALPPSHWSKNDLGAVRLGWKAHELMKPDKDPNTDKAQ